MLPKPKWKVALFVAACSFSSAAYAERAVLDVYTCYSAEKRAAEGGTDSIMSKILTSYGIFNKANSNSGVDLRVNPVGLEEVFYQVGSKSDGDVVDDVRYSRGVNFQQRRQAWGADLVAFITNLRGCGIAFRPGNSSATRCLGQHTLAHEIGHNFGLGHGETYGPGVTPYAVGNEFTGTDNVEYKTIMIGNYNRTAKMSYRWSSPNVFFAGVPTGVANEADSVRRLEEYKLRQTQREKLNPQGKGQWVILNRFSGKAVHKGGTSLDNGKVLTQWNNTGSSNMLWEFEKSPISGWMNVRNVQSRKYMDATLRLANGTPMTQFQKIAHGDQQNFVLDANDNGFVRVRCKKAGKILHNPRTTRRGAVISQWQYNGATHLQYEVRFVP